MKKDTKKDLDKLVKDSDFVKHHQEQVQHRSQKDVFFIWMIIIFISVLAAHFVLNFTGGLPTGFVTAAEDPANNAILLLGAFLVVFIAVMITGLVYVGVTQKDY